MDGTRWDGPISEDPVLDTTEIWEFFNLTEDSHPIHVHADGVPPAPNEFGCKDTVRVSPGSSTRIIVKFEGYAGRYVWHCHIPEYEDNEVMRPCRVLSKAS